MNKEMNHDVQKINFKGDQKTFYKKKKNIINQEEKKNNRKVNYIYKQIKKNIPLFLHLLPHSSFS